MSDISRGFNVVRRNPWVWLLPVGLSLFGLFFGLLSGSVPLAKPGFNVKFTIPTGIPDLSSVIQTEQGTLSVAGFGLILTLLLMALSAYLTGGWLAGVFRHISGGDVSRDSFFAACSYFFGRVFAAQLITTGIFIFGVILFGVVLGPLAIVLALVLMAFTLFWSLAIVKDDLGLGNAFTRGYQTLFTFFGEALGVLAPILVASSLASIPLHLMAQSVVGYAVAVPIWAFVGGGLSAAVCALYVRLSGQTAPQP